MVEESVFRYTLSDDEAPSEGVVESIADLEGRDPTALDQRLFNVVDPDALDILFRARPGGLVTFPFLGYRVCVHGDGRIVIDNDGG